jgi:hypothetical protein
MMMERDSLIVVGGRATSGGGWGVGGRNHDDVVRWLMHASRRSSKAV